MNDIVNKVSIIVPIFKVEDYLEECITSLLDQTWKNIEIILVDDGSPDHCPQICDKYKAQDNRIIVIHQSNKGISEAKNAGLRAATGEYITFVDGDDWVAKDYISYLLSLAINNNAEMSFSRNVFIDYDTKQISQDNVSVVNSEEAFCEIVYVKTTVGSWNKLYKRSIIQNNNLSFSVPGYGEGLYFSSMASQYANQIAIGNRKVYHYRKTNPNSVTTVRKPSNALLGLNNICLIKEQLIVKTARTMHACDWHIFYNQFNVIFYSCRSPEKKMYKEACRNARKYLHQHWFSVFQNSEISRKGKIRVISFGLFPRLSGQLATMISNHHFKKRKQALSKRKALGIKK